MACELRGGDDTSTAPWVSVVLCVGQVRTRHRGLWTTAGTTARA